MESGHGVCRIHDFCPNSAREEQLEGRRAAYVFLIDMKGDIVHHWRVPGFVGLHGELLLNGNTLICEGATGRIFEVTVSGEIAWEYISPVYSRANDRCGRTK